MTDVNDVKKVSWEEFTSLMSDETKGNMELPIEGENTDTNAREVYFEILNSRGIEATLKIPFIENLGHATFPSTKTKWLLKSFKATTITKTVDPNVSDKVEKKMTNPEPIRDVSMIEKEEESAEAEAQVTPQDFDVLLEGEAFEYENDSNEDFMEDTSIEAQLIGCRFAPVDQGELDNLRELLRARNPDRVVIEKYNIDMTELKLSCLRPSTWLNDEVGLLSVN